MTTLLEYGYGYGYEKWFEYGLGYGHGLDRAVMYIAFSWL
jgi:hypothetical protein